MSFVPREERARRSRQAQFANGQRPGGSDVDPRQRRSSEAELQTSQRVGDGQEVDANGRAQVRKDKTITVDSRNRHAVVADNLRFETPVDGSQAATKDYVDALTENVGVAYRVQTDHNYDVVYTSVSWNVIPIVATDGSMREAKDLALLLGQGFDGITCKAGHTYIARVAVSINAEGFNSHNGLMAIGWRNAAGTIEIPISVRTRVPDHRTLWTAESVYTASEDVEAVLMYSKFGSVNYRLAWPQISVTRIQLYTDPEAPPALPELLSIVAEFWASATTVARATPLNFYDISYNDTPTSWSWTFGDGGTSTAQNPVYAYAAAGTYTVSLTATGPTGSDIETKTSYITVT